MTDKQLELLRYPIGKFECPEKISEKTLKHWIEELRSFPDKLTNLVSKLDDSQLDTVYRPDGWTVRQVIHHLADSHHHSYIRFKWALTEDKPVIKFYYEHLWAELEDAKYAPIHLSLNHLSAVHAKLVNLLIGMSEQQFKRTFIHPEHQEETSLIENVGKYAWHGNHHYEHINGLIKRENW